MDLEKKIELICRPPTEEVLTPEVLAEAFAALPETLQMDWKHAVLAVDIQAAHDLLLQMQQYNPALPEALAELLNQYRFDTLQALLEER